MLQTARKLVHWAMGDLEHRAPEPGSAALVGWVCLVAAFAMVAGEWHAIRGHQLVRSFYRMAVHGVVPLSALVLWAAWHNHKGRALATLGFVVSLAPIAWRLLSSTSVAELRETPELLVYPSLAGLAIALLASRGNGEGVGVWGLGLGDWRWWLPRVGLCLAILVPGCILATLLFDSLADFYPTGGWSRKNWTNFTLKHLGVGIDFLGWEFLFRGVLLFGFYRRGDPWTAVWIQAIPFFLLHYDKPPVELTLSLVGGAISGWFTLRARSIIPLVVLHLVQITVVGLTAQLIRVF